mgnify:CR=1 FL=1
MQARPDTGLWNAKIGIWLFLASEVMLFGGLFSGYVFLRLGAPEGTWPQGVLNVPVGTLNTAILILSSVTVVLAWAALKMRQFAKYRLYMGITLLCGIVFLAIKLSYEYPQKFEHFGIFLKDDALAEYEPYLGNQYLAGRGIDRRVSINGHLHAVEVVRDGRREHVEIHHPGELRELQRDGYTVASYEMKLDPANAAPTDPYNEEPHFWPKKTTDKKARIDAADVRFASAWGPEHSSYFATYFTITGLHGLHVLGGLVVFAYFWLPVGARLYQSDPEHLANRVEVAGLFWHFVDLVWIFVFPIFYLL